VRLRYYVLPLIGLFFFDDDDDDDEEGGDVPVNAPQSTSSFFFLSLEDQLFGSRYVVSERVVHNSHDVRDSTS